MENPKESMNNYELYGRFWTFVQLAFKMVNEPWINHNGLPNLDDPAFMQKLKKTKEQVKLLYNLIESVCPDEN